MKTGGLCMKKRVLSMALIVALMIPTMALAMNSRQAEPVTVAKAEDPYAQMYDSDLLVQDELVLEVDRMNLNSQLHRYHIA